MQRPHFYLSSELAMSLLLRTTPLPDAKKNENKGVLEIIRRDESLPPR
jgi:hypothetical protein